MEAAAAEKAVLQAVGLYCRAVPQLNIVIKRSHQQSVAPSETIELIISEETKFGKCAEGNLASAPSVDCPCRGLS